MNRIYFLDQDLRVFRFVEIVSRTFLWKLGYKGLEMNTAS